MRTPIECSANLKNDNASIASAVITKIRIFESVGDSLKKLTGKKSSGLKTVVDITVTIKGKNVGNNVSKDTIETLKDINVSDLCMRDEVCDVNTMTGGVKKTIKIIKGGNKTIESDSESKLSICE